MMRLIGMFSNEGDWILDLFSGTGGYDLRLCDLRLCPTKVYTYWLFDCSDELIMFMIDTTSACTLKLFPNTVALEKDEEQVCFISMWINALLECPDQDKEIGPKHIVNTERFQAPLVSLFLPWLVNLGAYRAR